MKILLQFFLVFNLLLLNARHSAAQSPRNQFEIQGSFGGYSGIEVIDDIGTGGEENYQGGNTNNFVSFKYYISAKIAIGLSIGYQTIWGESNPDDLAYNGGILYNFFEHYYTIAPEITKVYRTGPNFQTYGFIGIGGSYIIREYDFYQGFPQNNSYRPFTKSGTLRTQITPFGLRFGTGFAGFFEFGFGYKGMINAGFSVKFPPRKKVISVDKK